MNFSYVLFKLVLLFRFCSRLNDYRPTKKRWDLSRLPKFEKSFYKEHPVVTGRPDVSNIGSIDLYSTRGCLDIRKLFINTRLKG